MRWMLTLVGVYLLSYLLIPPVIALAWRIGAVDVPCDWRRMHREKIPRAGGIAIFISFFVGLLLLPVPERELLAAFVGGGLLLLVGLLDDVFCLGATPKLLVQILACLLTLWLSGRTPGVEMLAPLLWILALCNAHNMIDGLDGLLAGCTAIEAIALSVFFALLGEWRRGLPPLLLAAAALGFRSWNRYPARIFAGDCGSTTLGFFLGYYSLPAFAGEGIGGISIAPLLLFAYPLTDLGTAVLRRILRGKNPFAADRAHLHHRISAVGLTQVQSAGVLLAITAGTGTVGVLLANQAFLISASLASLAAVFLLLALRSYILDFV